ncbi:MAG: aminotransferase class I/II-fold pyridoxal phosphate-dependent enzyme, partial [Deltaproteobacteria bacterium]|nr:aminotransferase class I/II-fold pyridoxal phosphate-dependent enzyme [Deltaproteobacteria bacterium]
RALVAERLAELALERYPDARAWALREAIAAHVGGRPEEIVPGCGSDEVISTLMTALSRPRGGRSRASVLFPSPSFVMYRISALTHGLAPNEVSLANDFALDEEAMTEALETHAPNLVFLATPNNPTGNRFDADVMRRLIEGAPGSLFVIDEAYAPFAGESLSGWASEHANVGVMGTLSKVGLAGARVGWIRLPAALAAEVDKVRQPFDLSAPSQEMGRLALTTLWPELSANVDAIRRERARVAEALDALSGFHCYASDANFLLVRVEGDLDAIVDGLAKAGIAVRRFRDADPRLDHAFRVSIGRPEENDALLTALGGRS